MKKKILITQNKILHYRKALFNMLCTIYDVTVLHSGTPSVNDGDFYKEIIVPMKKIGPFYLQSGVLSEIKKDYAAVVVMCDLHWVNNMLSLYFHSKKTKFIWWGSWLTDKYFVDKIKISLAKQADANIFYSEEAKNSFAVRHVPESKLFVANNTFDVGVRVNASEHPTKNRILFVGSLDERKENDILIKAFHNIIQNIDASINLTIIGEGITRTALEEMVAAYKLTDRVNFEGKITDTAKLRDYYAESIVSVSYGQAGLSVLQSLGYGVPFVTKKGAISGGEKTNIMDGYNGYFCENNEQSLSDTLLKLCNNIDFARQLGANAYDYYSKHCTIENMVAGFQKAIAL